MSRKMKEVIHMTHGHDIHLRDNTNGMKQRNMPELLSMRVLV
jgi:hypothetical protein